METLTVRVNASLAATLTNTLSLLTPSGNLSFPIANNFTSGTNANQVNQIYADTRTLAPSTSENINLMTLNGTNDALGVSFQMLRVKVLIVQNLNGTETNNLVVGNAGAGAWKPLFNGNGASAIYVPGGGSFMAIAPGTIGWNLGSTNGTLLGIQNASATSATQYNLIAVGANG